jgi:hypothetical protein
MNRSQRIVLACGLGVMGAALAGWLEFLRGQPLERAASWVTIVGFFVSTGLGVAGLALGLLTWRDARQEAPTGSGPVIGRSGRIAQRNRGGRNIASTGVMMGRSPAGSGRIPRIGRSGDVTQRNQSGANVANSGVTDMDSSEGKTEKPA